MVDIGLLQSLSYVAAAIGVCAAAVYYVSMLRNMENTRKKDIVFQRLQTPLQFYQTYAEVTYALEFNSYEEFRSKYVHKPEYMSKVWYVLNHFNALGLLVKEGLATPQQIFMQYLPIGVIVTYEKYRAEIVNNRYRHDPQPLEVHNPDAYMGFELLYNEAKRLYPRTPKGPIPMEVLVKNARKMDEYLKSLDSKES